ncbi:MAG TPA: transposase [Candidatus Brocadiia bacterium]|nr:transposase [Planctomycetota bacterium]MBI4008173.1 transposase [Planctomycetota bacterium]MDO8093874.1 hypothetical protein [Candidatus Brocadiales bacterium]
MKGKYNPEIHHRRSIRLKGYDYTQPWAYFVTVCTYQWKCLFGEVVDGKIRLNEYGQIVKECWEWLSHQYSYVKAEEYVVMPNHLHGIILITDDCRGGSRTAPTGIIKRKPLGRLIGAFKTVSSKHINKIHYISGSSIWQRNYYEHIIRNENELNLIREYIINNPAQWADDENNPNNFTQSYL